MSKLVLNCSDMLVKVENQVVRQAAIKRICVIRQETIETIKLWLYTHLFRAILNAEFTSITILPASLYKIVLP